MFFFISTLWIGGIGAEADVAVQAGEHAPSLLGAVIGGGSKEGLAAVAEGASKTLETGADQAVFWSGRTAGVGGESVARSIAETEGGTTLEGLMEARGIKLPKYDPENPSSVEAWKAASRAYAEGASGTVRAVVGRSLRPGNVWEEVERPALEANPRVTRIEQIDPATRERTTVFER